MAEIDINLKSVEETNCKLPAIISRVAEVNSTISNIKAVINSSVLGRSNLRARLSAAQSDINDIETGLHDLYRGINNIVGIYENNELKLLNDIKKLKV